MNDAAFIIRMAFPAGRPGAEQWDWRLAYFRDVTLPSLLRQTVETDIWVWTAEEHRAIVEALNPRVRTFTVDMDHPDATILDLCTIKIYPWAAVKGLPRYRIQSQVGSDDAVSPDFMETALAHLEKIPNETALVSFKPILYDNHTGNLYRTKTWRRPSPFVVLRQKIDAPRYTWVWAHDHRYLHHQTGFRYADVPEGRAIMTVHGQNEHTTINPRLPLIPREQVAWL